MSILKTEALDEIRFSIDGGNKRDYQKIRMGSKWEDIIKNVNGFLAKPYDTKDLAENIKKAFNKKWDKNKIRKTTEKFSDKVQSKIFLNEIKTILK